MSFVESLFLKCNVLCYIVVCCILYHCVALYCIVLYFIVLNSSEEVKCDVVLNR